MFTQQHRPMLASSAPRCANQYYAKRARLKTGSLLRISGRCVSNHSRHRLESSVLHISVHPQHFLCALQSEVGQLHAAPQTASDWLLAAYWKCKKLQTCTLT